MKNRFGFLRVLALRVVRLPVLVLCLTFFAAAFPGPAYADELWNEDYYRAVDAKGRISETEREDLDKLCLQTMKDYGVDVAILSVEPQDLEISTLEELGTNQYESCSFGYGETRDGFMVVFEAESGQVKILSFGNAGERIPEAYLEKVAGGLPGYYEQYGIYGMMYAAERHIDTWLKDHGSAESAESAGSAESAESAGSAGSAESAGSTGSAGGTESAGSAESAGSTESAGTAASAGKAAAQGSSAVSGEKNARVGEGGTMPAWYPVDPEHFEFYHDADAPRVVDDADIFTNAEETAMEARLKEIREETDRDIVVYTNTSACGLAHEIMAADFFDFNGYGTGDDYEGACLYVCMDPEDRGWFTACTGPDTKGLYTEEFANEMDDELYSYMAAGAYGTGVQDWIENFRTLYVKGMPFAPDWMPDRGDEVPERFHDESAPRVSDTAGVLTEEEIRKLTEQAKKISDSYGLDIVVHTAPTSGSMTADEYAELFYRCGGYGFGDDYDGILVTVFKRPGYSSYNRLYASGKGLEKLTEVNRERIRGFLSDSMDSGNTYRALSTCLKHVDHMERTGRVPRSLLYWIVMTVVGAVAGSAVGGVSLIRAMMRMDVPKVKENADMYLVPGSLNVMNLRDHFLNTSTTRKYIPPVTKSSGGGSSSSGRSSYRSSYSGSSGRSHSGSGRRF